MVKEVRQPTGPQGLKNEIKPAGINQYKGKSDRHTLRQRNLFRYQQNFERVHRAAFLQNACHSAFRAVRSLHHNAIILSDVGRSMNTESVVRLPKVASEKISIDARTYLVCRHVFI
jgi:hypothetical protein